MVTRKRNRARILTPEGLRKLNEQIRQRELDDNAGSKLSLEKLGELTGLDPETVKKVVDRQGSDRRTLTRCFDAFGLTLTDADHEPATQAIAQQSDPNFVGREEAMADLNALVSRNTQVIVIQARGGVGKTTLARRYLLQVFGAYLEFPIAKETKDIANVESLLEEKLRQLGEEPGREFLVSLDRLKRKLQEKPIGLLIDNLEPALDSAGKFIEPHRRYVELLRVLADPTVQSMTLITSRERLRESSISVQHYLLQSLAVAAWEQFFLSRGLVANTPAIAALHKAYGGNAKAMEIVSSAILEDFEGDIEAYRDFNQDDLFVERDLEDLVSQQFERLKQLDQNAYTLLCRIGCYRFQEIPTVSAEGIFCLLWDVPQESHRKLLSILKDRSLIESRKGEYWLHPIIRSECIIRSCEHGINQISAHIAAARYWTECVKEVVDIQDALMAFEAYFHYLEVSEYSKAGLVVIRRRPCKWHPLDAGETLGGAFLRLGLTKQMISACNQIIENVDSKFLLSKLYSMLGSFYVSIGELKKSIPASLKSIDFAQKCFLLIKEGERDELTGISVGGVKWIEAVSLANLGNSYIKLWDPKKALSYFEEAIQKAPNKYLEEICNFRLAFLNSLLGSDKKAFCYAEKSRKNIYSIILSPWGRGSRFISLGSTYQNLNRLDIALDMFEAAISFAEEAKYIQIKAIAKYKISEIQRIQRKYSLAIKNNLDALQILSEIGERFNSAEAHFQLGLTYKEIGDIDNCKRSFQESIKIFLEIDVQKQVERVEQALTEI